LKGGNAVAALINAPVIYQAQDIGMNKIVSVTELNIPFIFVAVCTTRKVIQQKPEAITRYLRAYTDAISIIFRDKETTLKIMGKQMKMENRQWVEAVYNDVVGVLQRVPYMTKAEVQAVLDVVKSPKGVRAKPEVFYDNSFVQKLDASGFIKSLYER
jgi:ABC-type nitrate/sulfonate/bicarbonate transport system substrate-binding protein